MNDSKRYMDIIDQPHHRSEKHPHMSNYERAAQFMPFAALKGYEEVIEEEGRYTEVRFEPDEERQAAVNEQLLLAESRLSEQPVVRVTYFKPDAHKAGGSYVTAEGVLYRIDAYNGKLIFADGSALEFSDITEIELLS